MVKPFDSLKETPSQTAGPYVHIGLTPNTFDLQGVFPNDLGDAIISEGARGERIVIVGRVTDGASNPVTDCVVEIWHADAGGIYNSPMEHRSGVDPAVAGWGRQAADGDGFFRFETIKPGPVPASHGGLQAPHVTFWIVARGINVGLQTRMYFPEEEEANRTDPLLGKARQSGRDHTMIGKREGDTITFDIRLQGDNETVFLDI